MRNHLTSFLIAIAVALAPSSLLAAQMVSFGAFGGGSASTGISFELPINPVPDFIAPNQSYFKLLGVTYQQGGQSPCPCVGDFTFYIDQGVHKGGVATPAGYYAGPQLFAGPITSPTFLPGTYVIKYLNPDSFYNRSEGSVTITALTSAAPEPQSWVLLIAAFAAIGGRMRSRRRTSLHAA
jgi:hypothetical protein